MQKPTYTLHKGSGQARVRIDGKDVYLGVYDSPESRARYDDLITEWLLRNSDAPSLSVDELALLYLKHARMHYRKNDVETSEVNCITQALRHLIRVHRSTLCRDFGPKALKKVRDEMIRGGLVRSSINIHVGRIRRMFKWGVSEELIPVETYQRLYTLIGLEEGRSAARESEPVTPVSQEMIDAVRPYVSRQVWGMIQLQLLTGMRPGEVLQMRGIDLNMNGRTWEFVPRTHKTAHKKKRRIIFIGPQAQSADTAQANAVGSLAQREEWIDKNCQDVDAVLSHPKLVETGLDLFSKSYLGHNFCSLAFYETGYVLPTMRQASRRAWRLMQPKECKVFYAYYQGTMQEKAMELMGKKLLAAEALEGKFSSEGLVAMAGDDGIEMAMARSLMENMEEEADRSWQAALDDGNKRPARSRAKLQREACVIE